MKLIAEKIDDQYRCVVPELGLLSFHELPNWQYQWSGYANMSGGETEFINYNFGTARINDKTYHLCSSENGIALLEYIDRYVLKYETFGDLEECLIEGMDYWFCLAWECAMGHYNDLPDWCHSILELYMKEGHMFRASIATDQHEDDVFIFDKPELKNCKQGIENILRNALIGCREKKSKQ